MAGRWTMNRMSCCKVSIQAAGTFEPLVVLNATDDDDFLMVIAIAQLFIAERHKRRLPVSSVKEEGKV